MLYNSGCTGEHVSTKTLNGCLLLPFLGMEMLQ